MSFTAVFFIPYSAKPARPLNKPFRRGVELKWWEAEQQVFEAFSDAISETAALTIPDLNKPFVLQTDASDYGLNTVLMQEFDSVLPPVPFAIHTLTSTGRNDTIIERKRLAIVLALKKFDMYLEGAPFMIQADHIALTWRQRLQNTNCRLAR